jgi:predicted dehydrogenase
MIKRLGVGFIGSGFMTQFHIRSWQAVRDGDVRGIWSPTPANAEGAAALARELGVGDAKAFPTLEAMVEDPAIDCIWICGPNYARVDNMERIVAGLDRGARLVAVACEKPLGRNAAEAARMVELVERSGLLHGYLENQLFAPARPSSGPEAPPWPDVPTWRARPKNTVVRTRRGSGRAICRAVAS